MVGQRPHSRQRHTVHVPRDHVHQQAALGAAVDKASAEAATLLKRWGRLHAVRTALGLIAFGVFVWRFVT